jgi:hypothetical protein
VKHHEGVDHILRESIPLKLKNHGSFIILVTACDSVKIEATLDQGASINMMPSTLYMQLGIGGIKPTKLTVLLAYNSIRHPQGIVEDILVDVNGVEVATDFIVMDVKEESSHEQDWKLLLGRSFMATANMKINVVKRKLSIQVLNKSVELQVNKPGEGVEHASCFVMDTLTPRKKNGQVCELIQVFESDSKKCEQKKVDKKQQEMMRVDELKKETRNS